MIQEPSEQFFFDILRLSNVKTIYRVYISYQCIHIILEFSFIFNPSVGVKKLIPVTSAGKMCGHQINM